MNRGSRLLIVALVLILAAQLASSLALNRLPATGPTDFLRSIPASIGDWRLRQEARFNEDILGALAPDDYVVRYYGRDEDPEQIELMIAHFRSQNEGFGPHSPKVCLPAAGWVPVSHKVTRISDGDGGDFPLNLFHLRNGRRSSLVLYWYHSPARATAGEMDARFWLAWDTLTTGRQEISLVRVILPFVEGREPETFQAASKFASAAYRNLRQTWVAR
jgi:EpsI family protein